MSCKFCISGGLIGMVLFASASMGSDQSHSLALAFSSLAGPLYHVDYENGSTAAKVGTSNLELRGGGSLEVVDNPYPGPCNSSGNVGKHEIPGRISGTSRVELRSQRLPTDGQTLLYKWSYYIPSDYFTSGWNIFSQWKTWPCSDGRGYGSEICYSGGIFNEVSANSNNFKFKFRANPHCHIYEPLMATDQWVNWKMKIYWTNNPDGYVKLYKNGALVYSLFNIKTLMDYFPHDGSCDIYWAVGMYNRSKTPKTMYTDNIAIYEVNDDDEDEDEDPFFNERYNCWATTNN